MFLGDNLEKKTIYQNQKFGQVQNMFCNFRGKNERFYTISIEYVQKV